MYMKDVNVQNQIGLHARPATFFIQKANEFKASIWVEKDERRVNAKSLLGVLSLGIVGGTSIRVIADGVDEQTAVDSLVKLVETGFTALPTVWKLPVFVFHFAGMAARPSPARPRASSHSTAGYMLESTSASGLPRSQWRGRVGSSLFVSARAFLKQSPCPVSLPSDHIVTQALLR